MPCYYPVPAFQDRPGSAVQLHPPLGMANLNIPCGRCIGCRAKRAQEWGARCMHEAKAHEHNLFVTLTYDDAHLPYGMDLRPSHLSRFLRRLRDAVRRASRAALVCPSGRFKYFACGEYGEVGGRPHYHVLLFGVGVTDGFRVKKDLFRSPTLEALWEKGTADFGTVTMGSAVYVAQYSCKKQATLDWSFTQVYDDGIVRFPPFLRCSLRPGIGGAWAYKYATDLRDGYLVVDGARVPIPRYYKKRMEETHADVAEESQENAIASGSKVRRTEVELRAAELIHKRRDELHNLRGVLSTLGE